MMRTVEFKEPSEFIPPPPGDTLEAAQIAIVIAMQNNLPLLKLTDAPPPMLTDVPPPMLTDVPPAGVKKVPRKAPCCKTCGYPRKGHSRTRCVEVVIDASRAAEPCCADSVSGLAGCDCA